MLLQLAAQVGECVLDGIVVPASGDQPAGQPGRGIGQGALLERLKVGQRVVDPADVGRGVLQQPLAHVRRALGELDAQAAAGDDRSLEREEVESTLYFPTE